MKRMAQKPYNKKFRFIYCFPYEKKGRLIFKFKKLFLPFFLLGKWDPKKKKSLGEKLFFQIFEGFKAKILCLGPTYFKPFFFPHMGGKNATPRWGEAQKFFHSQ